MFFFKKVFGSLFLPMPICMILMVIGLIMLWLDKRKGLGKILISFGVAILCLLSFTAVADRILIPLEYKYSSPFSNKTFAPINDDFFNSSFKRIAVLGGGVKTDIRIPITSLLGSGSVVRLVEAIRLYRMIRGSQLIILGGAVFDRTADSVIMKRLAIDLGVNPADIILVSDAKDTITQTKRLKSIVGNDKFILVTSASHMPRSMAMLKKMGLQPIPAPTAHLVRRGFLNFQSFLPGAKALIKVQTAVHEYMGMCWAKLRGQA